MIPPAVRRLLTALAWVALSCATALAVGPVLAPESFEPDVGTPVLIAAQIVVFWLVPTSETDQSSD